MADPEVVEGWVLPVNVHALMRYLSFFVGYGFDDSDWLAIETALPQTDAEDPDTFYEYPLAGNPKLTVQLAGEVDAEPVLVTVSGHLDPVLKAKVETVLEVLTDLVDSRHE